LGLQTYFMANRHKITVGRLRSFHHPTPFLPHDKSVFPPPVVEIFFFFCHEKCPRSPRGGPDNLYATSVRGPTLSFRKLTGPRFFRAGGDFPQPDVPLLHEVRHCGFGSTKGGGSRGARFFYYQLAEGGFLASPVVQPSKKQTFFWGRGRPKLGDFFGSTPKAGPPQPHRNKSHFISHLVILGSCLHFGRYLLNPVPTQVEGPPAGPKSQFWIAPLCKSTVNTPLWVFLGTNNLHF